MMRVGFLVAGVKGFHFFAALRQACAPVFVCSYRVKGTLDSSYADLQRLCGEHGVNYVDRKQLTRAMTQQPQLIFVVGWQYLLPDCDERFIVFHDSLLPKYRGFAPTVAALIHGETEIGVSALRPTNEVDRGPLYAQVRVPLEYPVTIRQALQKLEECYAVAAQDILQRMSAGALETTVQNEEEATYSLWRDQDDYLVNWHWPAARIVRFVDALGWPYPGAKTRFRGELITLDEVRPVDDLPFVERHPGKIWKVQGGVPHVVCGEGMIKVVSARDEQGRSIVFDKLRERLG